jgi:putative transposase
MSTQTDAMTEQEGPREPGSSSEPIMLPENLAEALVAQARASGVALTGPGGLLSGLTKQVLETALNAEMTEHLGHEHGAAPEPSVGSKGNVRNGYSGKTVRTEIGDVRIRVPRDRAGSFEPVMVPKHARHLSGFDQAVISLYAKGMTTGDIVNHLSDVYGSSVSKDLVSRVTDAVVEEMLAWQSRPLDALYPVILVDCIYVKIREGQVSNRPIYVVMGITLEGERDVLGLWAGPAGGGEGARQWLAMLTELKNRGVQDVLIACCDGLKGLPEAITAVWPLATVQSCVVHLVRNSLRFAGRQHWSKISADLKKVYTAPTLSAAETAFEDFAATWRTKFPAMVAMWERSWSEFIPFLDFPPEIRKLIYTTNGIESMNARFRAAVRRRGHFPTEQAALKILYLTVRERRPNRSNPTGRIIGWKAILNVLAMTYPDRLTIH